ncbi:hypothetical protein [Duganella qianjiadongensis]|uniref:DUF2306 domain-containing protein n=1 Tax=Duganella qianjiadongensis TaxID=2692176 RepID=A0ABW9VHV9_9BURK|nr:hypothetical protein [Duganella qianjiadongensis]MYM39086.1 hypothetical protein [Duganella qianjiadongensis]
MFGISPLGWLHTLGSLPAIPLAVYMFVRYGRIQPRTLAGRAYLISMLLGAASVFLVTRHPEGRALAGVTLLLLGLGYGAASLRFAGRAAAYLETIALTLTSFLLMLPTVTETLRRVPDGHPLAADLHAPLLLAAQGGCLLLLVIGLTFQIRHLRRNSAGG